MRKTASILIVIALLIVTGCTNREVIKHNYIYKGGNEIWSVEYKVNGTDELFKKNGVYHCKSTADKTLTVTYNKDLSELAEVKNLKISYESSAGGGNSNLDFRDRSPIEKIFTLKHSSTGGAVEKEDEIIKVSIDIDGKTQTIELKSIQ